MDRNDMVKKRFEAFVHGLVKVDLTVAAILSGTAADKAASCIAQQVTEKAAILQRQGTYLSRHALGAPVFLTDTQHAQQASTHAKAVCQVCSRLVLNRVTVE